jgi:hypothetical protein
MARAYRHWPPYPDEVFGILAGPGNREEEA